MVVMTHDIMLLVDAAHPRERGPSVDESRHSRQWGSTVRCRIERYHPLPQVATEVKMEMDTLDG